MKVMETIGKGLSLTAKNGGIFLILIIFNVIWNLGTLPFIGPPQVPVRMRMNPPLLILSLLFILVNIFMQGGILGVLKDAVAVEGKGPLSNFTKYGKKFYTKFLGMGLIILGGLLIAILVIGGIFSISLIVKNIIVNIIIISIVIILSIVLLYYLFLFFLSPYALVIDDVGVFKAMGNSFRFVKEHLWKMTCLTTLLVLIAFGIGFVVGILIGLLSLMLKGVTFQAIAGIISSVLNSYVTIMISASLMIYYSALMGAGQKKEAEEISA